MVCGMKDGELVGNSVGRTVGTKVLGFEVGRTVGPKVVGVAVG